MMRAIQVDFHHGQLDKRMAARYETPGYTAGLIEALNVRPLSQGGVENRPRFSPYMSLSAPGAKRMFEYVFDESEQYLITIAPTELRFFRRTDTDVTYIGNADMVPYWTAATEQQIIEMQVGYLYDTIIMCHRDLRPVVVSRTGLTTFVVDNFKFSFRTDTEITLEPTFRFTGPEITMQIVDATGNGIPPLLKGQTGYLRFFGVEQATGLPYNKDNLSVGSHVKYNNAVLQITANTGSYPQVIARETMPYTRGITVTYEADTEQDQWRLYETVLCAETNGEGIIVKWGVAGNPFIDVIVLRGNFETQDAVVIGAESGTTVKIQAGGQTNDMAPTPWWEESVYSPFRGWFGAFTFFQQRAWLGGSWDQPAMLCGSRIQEYFNFDLGDAEPNEGIQVILSAPQPGQIRSLTSGQYLQIWTDRTEHYIRESANVAITPETISIAESGEFGLGQTTPKVFADKVYFVGRDNRQIRAARWNDLEQQFRSPTVSYAHEDLLTNVVEIEPVYSEDGNPVEWLLIRRRDGVLIVMSEVQEAEQRGFWVWSTSAPIEGMAVIENQLYLLINEVLYRADSNSPCEVTGRIRTTRLTENLQELGSAKSLWTRTGALWMDVKDTPGSLKINGRDQFPTQNVDADGIGQVWHNQFGWTRNPQVEIDIPADTPAKILSLVQEVDL